MMFQAPLSSTRRATAVGARRRRRRANADAAAAVTQNLAGFLAPKTLSATPPPRTHTRTTPAASINPKQSAASKRSGVPIVVRLLLPPCVLLPPLSLSHAHQRAPLDPGAAAMAAAMRAGGLGAAAPAVGRPLPCLRLPTVPRATTADNSRSSRRGAAGGAAAAAAGGAAGAAAAAAAATTTSSALSPARRTLLRGGGALLLGLAGGAAPFARDVRAAVFQQVSVQVQTVGQEGDEDGDDASPAENPPTYVKATGRIVASEFERRFRAERARGIAGGQGRGRDLAPSAATRNFADGARGVRRDGTARCTSLSAAAGRACVTLPRLAWPRVGPGALGPATASRPPRPGTASRP